MTSRSMTSSTLVLAHISSILQDEDFSLDTPHMKTAKENARQLLLSTTAPEHEEKFDMFATSLIDILQPTVTPSNENVV